MPTTKGTLYNNGGLVTTQTGTQNQLVKWGANGSLEDAGTAFAAPPVRIAAAKKYSGATAALKFKFTRSPGFSTVTDGDVFYRVKARIKSLHSGAFFDLDISWIPQAGTYDFCTLIRLSATDPMLPAYFYMSNDSDGFYGWIPLATNAAQHWEAQAEMWAADTGNNVISGVYEPQITFEASNPATGRTKATTII